MKKIVGFCLMFALLFGMSVGNAKAVENMSTPTGVHVWNKERAFDGYTLLAPNTQKTTYLIDMEGNVVHTWKFDTNPGLYAELLPNGNLLRGSRILPKQVPFGGVAGAVQEVDWDGNVVWEHKIYGPRANSHHCYSRMDNGNTLIVAWEYKSAEEAYKKGRIKGTLPTVKNPEIAEKISYDGIWPDYVVEISPEGKEVWSWHAWDHIGTGENQLDINHILPTEGYYGSSDWTHFNAVQYIPETDQILLCSRNFGEFYLIDKKSGDIVYRWGNPSTYNKKAEKPSFLDDGDQELFGPHGATWIGNNQVIVFDNGWQRPEANRSRVVIVDTKTNEIVWQYKSKNLNSFYTAYQGFAQKLANGNIFVTSTQTGHLFELTPAAKNPTVVWEFVSPWIHKGAVAMLNDNHSIPEEDINIMFNTVHRAYRYAPDYAGLKGKDLSKKEVLFPNAPKWYELFEQVSKMKQPLK